MTAERLATLKRDGYGTLLHVTNVVVCSLQPRTDELRRMLVA